jgi:hypothetical protein
MVMSSQLQTCLRKEEASYLLAGCQGRFLWRTMLLVPRFNLQAGVSACETLV